MPGKRIVAIHQPNFLPWLGYFNKIARADVFILMDNVQFQKTGGTWVNRVQILVHGEPAWITLPIVRSYHGTHCIYEIEINGATPWRIKMLRTLQANYARAPFFEKVFPILEELINFPTSRLAELNINAIRVLTGVLHIDTTKFVLGSTLNVHGNATELLIEMVKIVNGSAYLSGGGAGGYQQDDMFSAAGLDLLYQDFQHPSYSQYNAKAVIPGLSIVDALMNCGFDGTAALVSNGNGIR